RRPEGRLIDPGTDLGVRREGAGRGRLGRDHAAVLADLGVQEEPVAVVAAADGQAGDVGRRAAGRVDVQVVAAAEGVVPRGGRAEEGAADADVEVAVEVAGLAVAVAVGRVRVLDRGQASAGAADGAHGAAAGLLRERVRVRADGAGETVRVDGLVRA